MYTSISSRRDRRHIFPRNSTDFGGETVVRKKKKKKCTRRLCRGARRVSRRSKFRKLFQTKYESRMAIRRSRHLPPRCERQIDESFRATFEFFQTICDRSNFKKFRTKGIRETLKKLKKVREKLGNSRIPNFESSKPELFKLESSKSQESRFPGSSSCRWKIPPSNYRSSGSEIFHGTVA